MPNCFALTETGTDTRVPLARIDDEMCAYFGVEPDPIKYHAGWYDIIGLRLALGKSLAEIRAEFDAPDDFRPDDEGYQAFRHHIVEICDYLAARYTAECWAEIGRR
jgi:hypothetical protein